jgi:hypothetical protein
MAITIHDTPEDYTPSDNPINWTFSSDQTAQANFVFVVKVYIDGVQVKTELVFPDNGIYARYDASAWASNACGSPTISQAFTTGALNNSEIYIDIFERYGTPPAEQANATSSTVIAYKAKLTDQDFINWDSSDYIATGTGNLWLSQFPAGSYPKVRKADEQIRLMVINDENNLIGFTIKTYSSNGALLTTVVIPSLAISANRITVINITPSILIANTAIQQSDIDAASYITFNSTEMDPCRIDFDESCVYDTYKRIHFLSQIGAIEALSFGLISRESAKIKSSQYRQQFGFWKGFSFKYDKTQGREIDFAKVVDTKITVESDWLSQDVQNWLVQNCYASPLVFEEDLSDGALIQRKVMNTAYKKMIQENDTLIREKIDLKLPTFTSMIL